MVPPAVPMVRYKIILQGIIAGQPAIAVRDGTATRESRVALGMRACTMARMPRTAGTAKICFIMELALVRQNIR